MSRPAWLAEGWAYDGAGGLLDPRGRPYLPPELDHFAGSRPPREQRSGTAIDGAQAILDAPEHVPALWGDGNRVLHAEGEPLLITGPPGVAKTTLAQRYVLARAGITEPELLGLRVAVDPRPVFYVAADRPAQAMRSWRRMVTENDRQALAERLIVHRGPLPFDLTSEPRALVDIAREHDAGTIVLDSLKDVALDLVKDDVGGRVNLAWQALVAEGIEVVVLHHLRKGEREKPRTVDDVYGSAWLTAGAGSVVLLWGEPGDMVIELRHLKQPAEVVGPLDLEHDQDRGMVTARRSPDPLEYLRTHPGCIAADLARHMTGREKPSKSDVERARRQFERLRKTGLATRTEGGIGEPVTYVPVERDPCVTPSVTPSVTSREGSRDVTDPHSYRSRGGHAVSNGGPPFKGEGAAETVPAGEEDNLLQRAEQLEADYADYPEFSR